MHNDSRTISAGEINKYVYCPYQWYYTRLFGNKKLRELVKRRNEEYGYEYTEMSHFQKGNRFHNRYHFRYKLKKLVLTLLGIACVLILGALLFWVMRYE
ncbi:MAG: hypothetical protein PWP07_552 [Epulopiscium sp.]|jgi:hypothetical protein|uniref:PD-(D/E)XK endonuclease-like domain-containing protein n=1 Tax=Defluviitalea raffinosedens TaxID=1450156 RepID=A0A7C8HDY7_9FIRM|nr:hypothetical protein [Defluviitalea raffinosedens]MBZ4668589.1 hypothetical protein [Defluviitaleaceae bacterium]MDK2787327.1 hypothetical protein [Candidatus Epulonipiscium sp.]KAE9633202.1 hypothetical protein GND95_10050 [Defluviitalea raffinosedens]MBM7686980.1 hypothetical protein [Defluviitalea raffinosedens]HHW68104.1 hypothetical protein [Candidatus Epulonipiscium sp.]